MGAPADRDVHIDVQGMTMAYGDFVIQRDLDFTVRRGDIFFVMGPSGCGKSTVLRHLVGLKAPAAGRVHVDGESFWELDEAERQSFMRRFGVLFQSGALWSSMTLAENVALPIEEYTELSTSQALEVAAFKLALVGLAGYEAFYPSEISGGMQKRAGLARAMALDPEILFFDEPSAGLDPLSSRRLDELIVELRDSLGATIVVISHELPSILSIGTNSIFLGAEERTLLASGPPRELRDSCPNEFVREFLARGATVAAPPASDSTRHPE